MVSRFYCKIICFFIITISCKKIDKPPQYSDISNFRRLIIRIPEHHIFEIRQGKHYLEGANENDMNFFNQQFFYKEQEIYISAEDFKEIIQLVMDLGKHLDMTHLNKMTKHCQ